MASKTIRTKSIDKREYEVVCGLLRALRVKSGLTQRELGEALGRGQTFVSDCELASRRLDALQLREWCQATGITFTAFARRLDQALELLPGLSKPLKRRGRLPIKKLSIHT